MSWDPFSTHMEAMEKKLSGLTKIAEQRCMYKVHEQLRDVNKKAYKPMLLTIGPYNNHVEVGQGFMEEHKLRYLQQMLERTKGSVEKYFMALRKLEETARNFYVECIKQTPGEFVEMMLLDGCFIIELFRKYKIYKEKKDCKDDPIFQMKWILHSIARDLMLFENQLPFFVLAELFIMSDRDKTPVRSRKSREHKVDIEEKDGINGESPTSTAQITRLNDLALHFFSGFVPFEWNVHASSYNSPEKITRLLCLAHEAVIPSLPDLVCQRLVVGFRFKNIEFEHLLGLIHTTICISLLDMKIDRARERQEAGVKLKKTEIFKHLFGLRMENSYGGEFQRSRFLVNMAEKWKHQHSLNTIEDWESIPFGLELQKAGIKFNMANKFKDRVHEIVRWIGIPYAVELQEVGIEFDKAEKFKYAHDQNRNEGWKSKRCAAGLQMDGVKLNVAEKFKLLLCQIKIEKWKSIPYGEELREAGVELNKAKKFKHLHALREIERYNIHSATELDEAGIKFKKADKSNVLSIKFNNGLMEISPWTIEDDTETYLRNLIAYEQYCNKDNGFNYITNFVCFVDDLINSPKDVELLRRKGIISSGLGADEIISTMVNKLGHYITSSSWSSIHARTSMNLNMHCRRRKNIWIAKLKRDYFNTPWAWISFLAAVLLLLLTLVQTIFSIIP